MTDIAMNAASAAAPRVDRSSMHYWFPLLEAAKVPVPKTTMVAMPEAAFRDAYRVFDDEPLDGSLKAFCKQLRKAAEPFGQNFFLRTGHTSGKHNWSRTCRVSDPRRIQDHVMAIIEYGELSSLAGLPCDWWAVRELLPLDPITFCPGYGNMPVCREFRVFVEGDKIVCWHPYWPLEALHQGGAQLPKPVYDQLCDPGTALDQILQLAARAGAAVGGAWSVDVLATGRGWYVTDMAEAARSYHWPDCTNARPK